VSLGMLKRHGIRERTDLRPARYGAPARGEARRLPRGARTGSWTRPRSQIGKSGATCRAGAETRRQRRRGSADRSVSCPSFIGAERSLRAEETDRPRSLRRSRLGVRPWV
jgi:hypothetical protein